MGCSHFRRTQALDCAWTRGLKPWTLNTTHRGTESPRSTIDCLCASVARCVVVIVAVWIASISSATAAEPTSLLDAAERGDRAAVLQMVAKGANPNTPGPDGTTPIMWAPTR